jgi:hypothetical protein
MAITSAESHPLAYPFHKWLAVDCTGEIQTRQVSLFIEAEEAPVPIPDCSEGEIATNASEKQMFGVE